MSCKFGCKLSPGKNLTRINQRRTFSWDPIDSPKLSTPSFDDSVWFPSISIKSKNFVRRKTRRQSQAQAMYKTFATNAPIMKHTTPGGFIVQKMKLPLSPKAIIPRRPKMFSPQSHLCSRQKRAFWVSSSIQPSFPNTPEPIKIGNNKLLLSRPTHISIDITLKNSQIQNLKMDIYSPDDQLRQHQSFLASEMPQAPSTGEDIGNSSLLERQYEEKLRFAKMKFEERLESITEHTRQLFDDVRSDEAIQAMKGDPISQPFVNARIGEMAEDTLMREKEITIDRINNELIGMKGELLKRENENQRFQSLCRRLEDDLRKSDAQCELYEREIKDERSKTSSLRLQCDEVLKKNELDLMHKSEMDIQGEKKRAAELERMLRQREHELDAAREENSHDRSEIQTISHQWQNRLKDTERENIELQNQIKNLTQQLDYQHQACNELQAEREDLKNRYNSYGHQLKGAIQSEQQNAHEIIEKMKLGYKNKGRQFKKKIAEQKGKIEHMANMAQELALTKQALEESKVSSESHMQSIHEDLKHVRDEWERKCHDIELESQRREAELNSRHQLQISSLQNQYQSLLEQRISEIQSGMSSQYTQQKTHDLEVKELLADKVREMEKDYMLISIHEDGIRKLEGTYEVEIRKLRDEVHDYFEKVRGLETEKGFLQAELNAYAKNYDIQMQDMKQLMDRESVFKTQEQDNEKKILIEKIDKLSTKLGKAKAQSTNESQKFEVLKDKISELKSINEAQKVQVQERDVELKKKEVEFDSKIKDLSDHSDMRITNETAKARTMEAKLDEAHNTIQKLEAEKSNMDMSFSQNAENLTSELERHKTVRREETERYEKELNAHMETRSTLMQAEGKINHLQSELKESEYRIQDLKRGLVDYEAETSALRSKIYEADSNIALQSTETRDMGRRMDRLRAKKNELRERLSKVIRNRAETLRGDLQALKNTFTIELQVLKKDNQNTVQDIMFQFIDNQNKIRSDYEEKLSSTTAQMNAEWSSKLARAETEARDNEDRAHFLEKQVENYKHSSNALKHENQSTQDELAVQMMKFKEEKRALDSENHSLRNQLKQNSDAFDKLQSDVQYEAVRIKQDKEEQIENTKTKLDRKYKKELDALLLEIDRLKNDHNEKMVYYSNEIQKLSRGYNTELITVKDRSEMTVKQLTNDLQLEQGRSMKLKDGLMQLDSQTASLQNEQNNALRVYEDKLEQLQKIMNEDHEKHLQFKVEKNSNIEQLTKNLRDATQELQLKHEMVEDMQSEIDKGRSGMMDLNNQLNAKENQLQHQAMDLASSRAQKEAEIDNLKGLLSRTYNESIEQVKKAKMLDRETQELSRQIRRPAESRQPLKYSK